tara:strand:+ start:242 stop:475 length:234 start_codon:yes stop_codon:yes gene_type:complete
MLENDFHVNRRNAKIQGLSVMAGELYAELYKSESYLDHLASDEALEAYKSLRRLLPMREDGKRHIGARAAYKATQGN